MHVHTYVCVAMQRLAEFRKFKPARSLNICLKFRRKWKKNGNNFGRFESCFRKVWKFEFQANYLSDL